MKQYYVYILASKKNGVLYIGVTGDLVKRLSQHREGLIDGFTKKYFVRKLVYFENTENVESAIQRETQLKRWKRNWKIELIEKNNPNWIDLYNNII